MDAYIYAGLQVLSIALLACLHFPLNECNPQERLCLEIAMQVRPAVFISILCLASVLAFNSCDGMVAFG